jgi:Zn-dependent protease with chaperone function
MLAAQLHAPSQPQPTTGELTATVDGLLFTSAAPGVGTVPLPSAGLAARLGGFDDATLFLRHPSQPDVEVSVELSAVPVLPALANHPAVAPLVGRRRQGVRRFWGCLGLLVATLLAVLLAGVLAWDHLIGWAVAKVPGELERQLGALAFTSIEASGNLITDPAVTASLAALVQPLAPPASIEIHVLDDPTVNAFALPGGPVVFHRGLLERATTPEEVLGVLGHELAHVELRHGLRQLVNNLGLTVVLQLLVGDASVLANAASDLAGLSYSRDLEREADEHGIAHLARAGVDPRGLVRFLEQLAAEEATAGPAAGALTFLATHPSSAERVANLEAAIASQAGPNPTALDPALLENLQSALGSEGGPEP